MLLLTAQINVNQFMDISMAKRKRILSFLLSLTMTVSFEKELLARSI